MKKVFFYTLICSLCFITCDNDDDTTTSKTPYFVVANRNASSLSVFNANTLTLSKDVMLPSGAAPTYVTYSKEKDVLYTGDFTNEKLYVINPNNFSISNSISIGKGAFHMWVNDAVDQLWINNITDKTTSVINTTSLAVVKTISLPTDLGLTADAVQHDVALSNDGKYAFVSILDGSKSYIVKYDTNDFSKMSAIEAGGDAHLFNVSNTKLFVLSQDAGTVSRIKISDMAVSNTINYEGAHGVWVNGDYLYTADVPGKSLGVVNLNNNTVIQDIATTLDKPHNIAVGNGYLMVSHTSTDMVGFYSIANDGKITLKENKTAGANTFGVSYYER